MDIAKQIIDQRINKILEDNQEIFTANDNERNRSKAFLVLGVAAYLDIDLMEAVQYLTDGGNDGGFDAAYIVEAQDSQYCSNQSIQENWIKTVIFRLMQLKKL